MADRRSRSQSDIHLLGYSSAFTMAEILISLTIIGIIAAITLPSLRNNINETTWNTQRKALYSRMSQAIAMMPSLNGYGIGATDEETASKAAEAFITDGLSKVLKITNVCDSENLKKCGFPDKFTKMGTNSKMDTPKKLTNLNGYFNAPNGTNVNYSQIDTNSAAFYPADTQVVAPYPIKSLKINKDDKHPTFTIGYGNASCRKKYGDDAKMGNIEELKSIFTNNKLGYAKSGTSRFFENTGYLSSTVTSDNKVYSLAPYNGGIQESSIRYNSTYDTMLFCIKR